jgi:hypothetical protein
MCGLKLRGLGHRLAGCTTIDSSPTTTAGKNAVVISFRNRFRDQMVLSNTSDFLQAERHLVLPMANAGVRRTAHYALARALCAAARGFRAV